MSFTIAEIAKEVNAEVIGDASIRLTGLAPAEHAKLGDLTFAENEIYFAKAEQSQAAAILVGNSMPLPAECRKVLLKVANPRIALARALPLFFPPDACPAEVHPSAVIAPTAKVHATAFVGPNCVIGSGTRIGARSVLMGGNNIGRDTQIGEDVRLFPNVVIYPRAQIGNRVSIHAGTVIGSDGYGYVLDQGKHRKILQIGNVVIHDDVEIGANTAIDRGALGSTVIGEGTKLDNLVHVAHNVTIGRHCLITGQVGFAGSTHLGDYVVIAAQSGIADHLKIGNQATIGAKSGVMRDIPDGGKVLGIPAVADKQAKRQMIAVQQLPDLIRRTRELEKQVADLSAKVA
jgi:UDP-3-O-[3-hydroxymyristoyl] glucosamine N-acyltransferase